MKQEQTEQASQSDGAEGRLVAAVCNRQAKHSTGLADATRRHGQPAGSVIPNLPPLTVP